MTEPSGRPVPGPDVVYLLRHTANGLVNIGAEFVPPKYRTAIADIAAALDRVADQIEEEGDTP